MKASTDEELIVAVVDVECAEVDDSADDEMCDEADDDEADEVEETAAAAAAATTDVVAARATVEVVTAANELVDVVAAAAKLVVEVVAANKVVEVTAAAVETAAVVVAIAIGKRVGLRVKSGSEEDGMVGGFTDVDERPPSEKLTVKSFRVSVSTKESREMFSLSAWISTTQCLGDEMRRSLQLGNGVSAQGCFGPVWQVSVTPDELRMMGLRNYPD